MIDAEERVARSIVARHRARLDWMLRVPDWAELFAAGVTELGLRGQRQGIGQAAALLALPLEHKHDLIAWVLPRVRRHVPAAIGRHLGRLLGLELFSGLDLDEFLTTRQWQRLRDGALFRLGQEHRRYKHAQQLLFTDHRSLVDQVVAQMVFRPGHRADCAQEGALGLLAAIDRADESVSAFAAYALTWIRRHVRNYLLQQRLPVQAPVNLISETIIGQRGIEGAGTPADGPVREGSEAVRLRRLQVLLLEYLRHPAVALDEPVDGGGTLAETLEDAAAPSPSESAARADLRDVMRRGLAALTAKQRNVLVRRFGLGGGGERTLAEIARAARISHQQAGMRERRALQRLEATLAPVAAEWYGAT